MSVNSDIFFDAGTLGGLTGSPDLKQYAFKLEALTAMLEAAKAGKTECQVTVNDREGHDVMYLRGVLRGLGYTLTQKESDLTISWGPVLTTVVGVPVAPVEPVAPATQDTVKATKEKERRDMTSDEREIHDQLEAEKKYKGK